MIAVLGLLLLTQTPNRPADAMWTQGAAGVSVRVIAVDLANPRVHVGVQVARGLPHGAESFSTLLARSRPTVAINGAYFSKSSLEPIGDIVLGGQLCHIGLMGTALALTHDKRATIRRVNRGHKENWAKYETVLACGPALVLDGEKNICPALEGFHDPHIMGATKRMGVGLTEDNRLLLVHTLAPVTFSKWADVMLALHCRDAMNLDAGASLGMYYRGRTYLRPSRDLTNLLVVYVATPPPAVSALWPPANVGGSAAPAPPPDPGNSNSPDAKVVTLCADTMRRASLWCPVTIKRRIARSKLPGACRLHRAPPGEGQH